MDTEQKLNLLISKTTNLDEQSPKKNQSLKRLFHQLEDNDDSESSTKEDDMPPEKSISELKRQLKILKKEMEEHNKDNGKMKHSISELRQRRLFQNKKSA